MLLGFHSACHSRHVNLGPDSFVPFALHILLPNVVSSVLIFAFYISRVVLGKREIWLLNTGDLDFHVVGNFCHYIFVPRFLLLDWLLVGCKRLVNFPPVAFAIVYFEYVPSKFYFIFGLGIVLPHGGSHRRLRFLLPLLSGLPHVECAHLSLLTTALTVYD